MGQRIYFRNRRLGTSVQSMDVRGGRGGASRFHGLGKSGAHIEKTSPNFEREVTVLVPFFGAGWRQKDLHEAIDDLAEGLITDAAAHGDGPIAWVKDDTHTTTTSNAESAADDVQVEVASLSTLDVVTGDWVLIQDTVNDVSLLVQAELAGSPANTIVVDLDEDVAAGSTVWKVWKGIAGCVFENWDPGTPDEQALDNFRPVTTWRFGTPSAPVRSSDI